MGPHLPGMLRQVSARVLRGESSHLCAKRKMCSSSEMVLHSLGVNILINGTVSLGTPHLLECITGYLALVLHAALSYHFHMILKWPSPSPFSGTQTTLTSKHTHDSIVDDPHHPLKGND